MAAYTKGQLVRIGGEFVTGVQPVGSGITLTREHSDPTTVVGKYKNPAGTITTLTFGTDAALVRDGIGAYHFDVDLSSSGTWHYRWQSTGTYQGAVEGTLEVDVSQF